MARERSQKGARAFGEYYYDLVNYGRGTGDWEPVKELSLPECQQCKDFWQPHPKRLDNNNKIHFGFGPPNFQGHEAKIGFSLRVRPEGAKNPTLPPNVPLWADLVTIVYQDDGWKVAEIDARK